MKTIAKKLSLLLCLPFIAQATFGHVTIHANEYSGTKGKYTDSLCRGFDMTETSIPNAHDIKAKPIIDQTKAEKRMNSNWYYSAAGENGFHHMSYVKENQYELQKTIAKELGLTYKSTSFSFSPKVTIKHTDNSTAYEYCGEVSSSCLLEKYTSLMDKEDLKNCLSDDFVTNVKEGDYEAVFKNYGTHLIQESLVGGKLIVSFHSTKNTKKTTDELKVAADASYKKLTASGSGSSSESVTEFESCCKYEISCIGGDGGCAPAKLEDTDKYSSWLGSIDKRPATYQINDCIPIWELFDDKTIQNNLKIAYYQHYNNALTQTKDLIPFVTSMRVTLRSDNRADNEITLDNEFVTQTDKEKNYMNSDLNRRSGGKYIYLLYRKGTEKSQKITDVIVRSLSRWTNIPVTGYTQLNQDLNAGAGGKYIYINYKRNSNSLNSTGYQDFCTRNDSTDRNDNWVPIKDLNGNVIDLNMGSGGDYIYLFGYKDPLFSIIDKQIAANNAELAKLNQSHLPNCTESTNTSTPITKSSTTTIKSDSKYQLDTYSPITDKEQECINKPFYFNDTTKTDTRFTITELDNRSDITDKISYPTKTNKGFDTIQQLSDSATPSYEGSNDTDDILKTFRNAQKVR